MVWWRLCGAKGSSEASFKGCGEGDEDRVVIAVRMWW